MEKQGWDVKKNVVVAVVAAPVPNPTHYHPEGEASREWLVSCYGDPSKTSYPLVIQRNSMKNWVFHQLSRPTEGRYTKAIEDDESR